MTTNEPPVLSKIEEALESLRPYLRADGGDVEVVGLTNENVLQIRLLGNCEQCPMSYMTMKAGLEEAIRKVLPELKELQAVSLDSNDTLMSC